MQNIPQIRLNALTKKKIEKIAEGTKIYDIDSKSYYEKINGEFQMMLEEDNGEPVITDEQIIKNIEDIKKIIASGNKLDEANAFMEIKTLRNNISAQKVIAKEKINFIFNGTPEEIDLIQVRVSDVTKDALEKATFDEMREFFIFDDHEVNLNIAPELVEESDKIEAYRNFLLYLKALDEVDTNIDNQLAKIDKALDGFSDEIKEKSKSLQVWDDFIFGLFKEKLNDQSLSQDEKNRIKRVIEIKEDALNLTPIFNYVKDEVDQNRRISLIHAFKNRFEDTITKAEKYAEQNNFRIYFQLFDGIEDRINYSDYRNLFMYLFARYIKFNQEKFSKIDNTFIAQVIQNLILLKNNQLQEPRKSTFINSIKSILDLIVNPIG